MAPSPLKFVAAACCWEGSGDAGSMRRWLLCRPMGKWTRRCQWSVCSLSVLALVAYNMAASVWLQHSPPCSRRAPLTGLQPPPAPASAPPPPGCAACSTSSPPDDDPIGRLDLALGRWDASRTYRMYDYAAVGADYGRLSGSRRVCLATQSSVERLHELARVAAGWSGPLSVAVFAAGDELRLLRAFVLHAMRCEPETYARLALHVLVVAGRAPQAGPVSAAAHRRVRECSSPAITMRERREDTAEWRKRNPYPQNHLRNLARRNCQSPYVFLVDVDIVPSGGLADSLEEFLATAPRCPLCAYVVPTYELDNHVPRFPHNKTELIRLARKGLAIPFHRKVFIYNQYASNFSRWEASGGNESAATHVSHNVTNFELLYEPFYVAPDTVPAHDERFLGYGFTRNTQVYEMFLIGYQFQVLSPIFTIHWGIQQRRSRPLWREKQNERNRKHFETFKRELFARYRKDPLKLLHKPPPDKGKKT